MASMQERFWAKVIKTEGCWEWTGCKQTDGYGMIGTGIRGKSIPAHRYSYMLHTGINPAESHILHTCDNPSCVNPEHLKLGSRSDNMRDMQTKKRSNYLCGEKSHLAKMTREDVDTIRMNHQNSKHIDIAKAYGVSRTTISNILSHKTWKDSSERRP